MELKPVLMKKEMINENIFKDLFLKSHQKLAIKSLQTLNNLENILIVADKNDKLFQVYDFQPLKYCEYIFWGECINFKLNWFYKKLIKSPTFHGGYIIFNDSFYLLPAPRDKEIIGIKLIIT